jgi:hypothetical protein
MELSLIAHIFVKTSLLIFCLITYCVTVVPSFFVRVIIIGREISIFILLRGVKGGGGIMSEIFIVRYVTAHDHPTTLPFC